MNMRSILVIAALALTPSLAVAQDNSAASSQAFMDANHKMMTDMEMKPTGDADRDFVVMMMPHHQGAIDVAKIELKYGKDKRLRAMAKDIISSQEKEITKMKAWQAKNSNN